MSKQHDNSYLLDILNAAKRIQIIVKDKTFEEFEKDFMSPLAVARLFEIIGEATKNLSLEVRESHPEIPWKKMAGLRDVLIHRYQDANDRRIFEISKNDIPELALKIEKILAELK